VLTFLFTYDTICKYCKNDVESLMYLIEKGTTKKANLIEIHKPLTPEQIKNFLTKKIFVNKK